MPEGRNIHIIQVYPIQITQGHGFPSDRIRNLIRDALTPLPTDPVPKTILIQNIVITQIDATNLEITCDVLFEI